MGQGMGQGKYLNVILTVNAVLLTGLLWTQVAATPLLAGTAEAQNRTYGPKVPVIPNAAKQRDATIKAVKDVERAVNGLKASLENGRIKVQVSNLAELNGD